MGMKILSISVTNFRSIREKAVLQLKKIGGATSYILLGINESGKSSLLEAVGLLDGQYPLDYETDCHKDGQEEDEPVEVLYELELDSGFDLKQALIDNGLEEALASKVKITSINRRVFLEKGEDRVDDYIIELKDDKLFSKYEIYEDTEGNEVIELIASGETVEGQEEEEIEVLTRERLEEYIQTILFDPLDEEIPEVIFWNPSESKYLISGQIDLNAFKDNQNLSIPLKNCFKMAGINTSQKIKAKIESIVGKASKIAELQQKLGESVTEHINTIWGEHKVSVKFSIIDNLQLSFLVEDKDDNLPKYAVTQRSDGFKHFVSILLNLSAENKTETLKDKIILLDEPETHLHPSGQRYLRDELLDIAKNNIVIYATHSIYMVDTKNIDRHFSIKKSKGRTYAFPIEKDNPYREEVLYEALGTSVLELIEPNVLIFEGKTDRDIFEVYARKLKTDLKPPKLSLISADGCKNIIKYTKFFNTKVVKGYILLDSDKEGVEQKALILKEDGYDCKNTFEINDIKDTKKESTLEDLFNKKYLTQTVKEKYGLDIELDQKQPLVAQVKDILQQNHKPYRDEEKEAVKQIYFEKVSKLTKEELKKEPYFDFCVDLCKKIKG